MLPLIDILGLHIYLYPFILGVSMGLLYIITKSNWKHSSLELLKIYAGSFLFTWAGAKIFYLIFSVKGAYLTVINSQNFWLGGGFVFYGGLFGGLLFCLIYGVLNKKSIVFFAPIIPAILVAHGVGRIGCFLAGCCYGKETNAVIGVHMHGALRHPVQLYEAIILILSGYLFNKYFKFLERHIFAYYLFGYSLLRFCLEYFRADYIRGSWMGFSSSQWISICIITIGLLFQATKYLQQRRSF